MKRICSCGRKVKVTPCDKCRTKPKAKPRAECYDHSWRITSEAFRRWHPLCHDCELEGVTTPARDVHHKKPIDEYPHLRLHYGNLVALCKSCHRRRHDCMKKGQDQMSWTENFLPKSALQGAVLPPAGAK